jgi:uncharacterized protein YqeY
LAEQEEIEIKLLERYLPQMMTPDQIKIVIEKVVADETEFSKAMGAVMVQLKGKAPGDLVAKLVREVLDSKK